MKEIPVGAKGQSTQLVTPELTAQSAGSGLLPVFGTPYLVALMENAANACLLPFLDEGSSSVGCAISISHDSPTPVEMQVTAEAEVTQIEGRKVSFTVRAWDESGPIGSGTHVRVIVDNARFLNKSDGKLKR